MKSKSIAKTEDEPVYAPLIWLLIIGILLILVGIGLVVGIGLILFHPVAGITCIVIGAIMVILYFILRGPISKK